MTNITARRLATDIESLIRSTNGVTALYPTAPIPAVVVGETLARAGLAVSPPDLVGIRSGAAGTAVTAMIGVDDDVPAHETAREVHARIVDYLHKNHTAIDCVTVRIGMIGS